MSYYIIKGPAENTQYLCALPGYDCPQWSSRKDARRFPDAESAWKWLDAVQRQNPSAWLQGRVVRVNTMRDKNAEIGRLRAWCDELRIENHYLKSRRPPQPAKEE